MRLRKMHSAEPPRPVDGRALLRAQSLRSAIIAALTTVLLLNLVWMLSAAALGRIFAWFVIVQGVFVGLAVRRWGRGLDWRFVLVAGVAAFIGAYTGNFLLAADTSADEFGTGPLRIIGNITGWTLDVFFDEVLTPVDHIFALYASAIAAFLAKRRLTRAQAYAVRLLQEQQSPK